MNPRGSLASQSSLISKLQKAVTPKLTSSLRMDKGAVTHTQRQTKSVNRQKTLSAAVKIQRSSEFSALSINSIQSCGHCNRQRKRNKTHSLYFKKYSHFFKEKLNIFLEHSLFSACVQCNKTQSPLLALHALTDLLLYFLNPPLSLLVLSYWCTGILTGRRN